MRILATAKPNMRYENYRSISDLILEAHLINKKIIFYETHAEDKDWVVPVKEETVKDLFLRTQTIKGRPFLKNENKAFFVVLFRKRKKFQDDFNEMTKKNTSEVIRIQKQTQKNIEGVIRLKKNENTHFTKVCFNSQV